MKIRQHKETRTAVAEFSSVKELLEATPPATGDNAEMYRSQDSMSSSRWLGFYSRAELDAAIDSGNLPGQKQIKKLLATLSRITPKAKKLRRRPIRGRQGDELDIHAVNRGSLDRAWRATAKTKLKAGATRRVRIVFQTSINAGQNASQNFWPGAIAATLADKLNSASTATEIIAADYSANALFPGENQGMRNMLLTWPVKLPNQPFSLPTLAKVALGGFSRIYVFRAMFCIKGYCPMASLGQNVPMPLELKETFKSADPTVKTLFIPLCTNEEDAKRIIATKVKEMEEGV